MNDSTDIAQQIADRTGEDVDAVRKRLKRVLQKHRNNVDGVVGLDELVRAYREVEKEDAEDRRKQKKLPRSKRKIKRRNK